MAVCKFCSKEITWIKEGRKNVPVEMDGAVHRCDEMKNSLKSIKSIDREELSQDEIKKYEQAMKAHVNQKSKK